jgi:phosphoribosyl 1,2-cyclic phosphodiesterase
MTQNRMTVKFWGVRGSIPAPLSPALVEQKMHRLMRAAFDAGVTAETLDAWLAAQPRHAASTYGGNTSCVEVRAGGKLVILDMGSGLRELGNSLIPDIRKTGAFDATFLVSHVHWDHVQGHPFFAPIYQSRTKVSGQMNFWGGVNWKRPLKNVLGDQMEAPMFPMEFKKIEQEGLVMKFHTVSDRQTIIIPTPEGEIKIVSRRLNHPQETYGYRLEFRGACLAYATDNEDFPVPDPALVELVSGANVWIQDCQYDKREYEGMNGIAKLNWGHSEPNYVAAVGMRARPERIVTFHHDPGATDAHIASIAREVQTLSGIRTEAAYEGLTIVL